MLVKDYDDGLKVVEEVNLVPSPNIGSMDRIFENEALLVYVLHLKEIEA